MNGQTDLDLRVLEDMDLEIPCAICEIMGREPGPVAWIVRFPGKRVFKYLGSSEPSETWFLCDDCMSRWRGWGFGVRHSTDAIVTRL